MSDKRYEANIIRATAVEPANNLESTSAPGVWSIDEVVELQKKDKWPTVGNVTTDVTDVFSTFLYKGNGSAKVVENGIALGNANDGGSVNFGGAGTSRWVNVPGSSDFGFGTGDFTIELFLFVQKHRNYTEIYDQRTASQDAATATPILYADSSGDIHFFHSNNNKISGAIAVGQWYHIAVSRSGTSTKMFANGTQLGSTYSDSTNYVTPASTWSIGAAAQQNQYELDGFISNVRVVKGTALYTSNFTAPTSALTAVTNTKLLALQGSTPFVDNSSSSHALTENGTGGASDFGPFTGTGGEGGLVWFKMRDQGFSHRLVDTARGVTKKLETTNDAAEGTEAQGLTAFNANGFTVGSHDNYNLNNADLCAWTFRKAPKFFDIQTWTGSGSARTISHNLGQVPGVIIVKRYSATEDWNMFHRSLGNTKYLQINGTGQAGTSGTGGGQANLWNDTDPTATEFTIGTHDRVNTNGQSYIAYIFAHHNNDGEFGPTASDDIIKCGSYSGSSGDINVNLGFEPQWLLIKETSRSGENWHLVDTMRGFEAPPFHDAGSQWLEPNTNSAEPSSGQYQRVGVTSTGFFLTGNNYGWSRNGETYIYMAIRRGPLATPTAGTQAFSIDYIGSSAPYFDSTHIVDMGFVKLTTASSSWFVYSRLLGEKTLYTDSTAAEANASEAGFDFMDGHIDALWGDSNAMSWMWKRAPGYFDVVVTKAIDGNVNHNLGVVPELVIYKRKDGTDEWYVCTPADGYLILDKTNRSGGYGNGSYLTNAYGAQATATTVNSGYWATGNATYDIIIYLFATLAGISKVGTYVGSSSGVVTVDCGFTSGARFVLIKRNDAVGDWYVYDSVRGINSSADDPYLLLNTSDAGVTNTNNIEPHSSGFQLTQQGANPVSINGGTYVFYAIA